MAVPTMVASSAAMNMVMMMPAIEAMTRRLGNSGDSGFIRSAASVLRPFPAIGDALDRFEMEAVFFGIPAGTAGDDHLIADIQRRLRHPIAGEAAGVRPLGRDQLLLTVLVRGSDLDPGVRS